MYQKNLTNLKRLFIMKKIVLLFVFLLIGCSPSMQQSELTEAKRIEKPNNVSEYTDALLIELQSIHSRIDRKKNVLSIIITDYFKEGSSLSEEGKEKLKKIALILSDYDKSKITIFGYNSKNGSLNQKISDDRANKIADTFELFAKINDLRLYVEGKSSDKEIQAEIIIVPTFK